MVGLVVVDWRGFIAILLVGVYEIKEVIEISLKRTAIKEAIELRKKYPNLTVNVVQITKGNWGIRFSLKGKRDIKFK